MWTYEQVGLSRRPPIWRTILWVLLVIIGTLLSIVFSSYSWQGTKQDDSLAMFVVIVALLVMLVLPIGLFWRHRIPFILTFVSAGLSLLLPIGNSVPLLCLAALIGRRRGPAVNWTMGLVGATSTFVVIRDALTTPVEASLLRTLVNPAELSADPGTMHPAVVVVAAVFSIGISIGAGLLMRTSRQADATTQAMLAERETTDRLGDEAARRQERERIAREVHDAMGHRLSLLNLHAGALEANSADPRVTESAALVRQSAGEAMDDLRSLLSVLREPLGDDPPDLPMSQLNDVVRESFGAGQNLSSSIFIQDADKADPTLSRAVYRIVQEVLTNARKHAPNDQVYLTIEGGPATGIVIDAHNPYRGGWGGAAPGSSRGLAGIAERVELLDGRLNFGLAANGTAFRIRVELPWREAQQPRGS